MYNKITTMLDDIKYKKYASYSTYLNEDDIRAIHNWYSPFFYEEITDFEIVVDFMYELYLREDIDMRPYEDYQRFALYFAEKYGFNSNDFLDIYIGFRKLMSGAK